MDNDDRNIVNTNHTTPETALQLITPPVGATIAGRHIFYNDSAFDGNDPAVGLGDDGAIAPDPASAIDPWWGKTALLPGETADFQNYTSYSRGINGIMVDIAGLMDVPDSGDFEFRVGNSNDPASWALAPEPKAIAVRTGDGVDDSHRVTIIWKDKAIEKQWLQVTVLVTPETGLAAPDVFYFGNAIGESGNSTTDAKINAFDMLRTRDNQRNFLYPAPIAFLFDFNRDAQVDATDMLIARNNRTHFLNALRLITVPGGKAAGEQASAVGRRAAQDAVFRQAVEREPERSGATSSKLDWLYEFEELSSDGRTAKKSDAVEETLDLLLAAPGL